MSHVEIDDCARPGAFWRVMNLSENDIALIALIVAAYGALLATATAVVQILDHLARRREAKPRLRVKLAHTMVPDIPSDFVPGTDPLPQVLGIVIQVINDGRIPVHIRACEIHIPGSKLKSSPRRDELGSTRLPYTVESGTRCQFIQRLENLQRDFELSDLSTVSTIYAVVRDQTEREYQSKRLDLP